VVSGSNMPIIAPLSAPAMGLRYYPYGALRSRVLIRRRPRATHGWQSRPGDAIYGPADAPFGIDGSAPDARRNDWSRSFPLFTINYWVCAGEGLFREVVGVLPNPGGGAGQRVGV
jgi:hypothetical protein